MAGQQTPTEVTVPVASLPQVPWTGDQPGIAGGALQPSFVGWPTPTGYLPPYAPILDMPALNSAQELCVTVASSACTSLSCINGIGFAVAPYVVDQTARLALDSGSPQFSKGVELYGSCVRAVMGGSVPGRNIYL